MLLALQAIQRSEDNFMKMVRFAAIAIVVSVSAAQSLQAGESAGGAFHAGEKGAVMNIEFNARTKDATGSGDGQMSFSGPIEIPDTDEDAEGTKGTSATLSMKVDFDCVRVANNRAAMSGLVRSASINGFVGKRVMLSVEDGGEGSKAEPDKFTWGIYGVRSVQWFPTDAELKDDDGWKMTWVATDYEREDDKGVRATRETDVDCRSFPLDAYSFIDLSQGEGNIQVKP